MQRMLTSLAALVLLVAACSTVDGDVTRRTGTTTTSSPVARTIPPTRAVNAVVAAHSLVPFDACDDYLTYVREHALELVGPYGLGGEYRGYPYPMPVVELFAMAEDDVATPTTTIAAQGAVDFSRTNVQESGVDEPDMVKTDGERIVVLLDGVLRIVTIENGTLRRAGSIPLSDFGWTQDMFLAGDRVLVVAGGDGGRRPLWGGVRFDTEMDVVAPWYYSPVTRLIEVDISDADEPDVVRSMDVDGRYLSARMVEDTVRVVVSSSPTGLVFTHPEGGGLRAEREAEAENRRIIEESTVENWLPYYVTKDGMGRIVDEGTAVACGRAHHPEEFSGLNLLSVMTLDLGRGLDVVDTTGVLADGETVYASQDSLYVATQRWVDWERVTFDEETGIPDETVATQIHRFDISDPLRAEYTATGEVSGWLLNQWSFSEYEGHLRVVVTNAPAWQRWGPTESSVVVLREERGELKEVGSVGGLGKDENVYSIRFMGDVGYVVTFRQIDPLYTIDLSDPENPVVVGELKIPGYSAYLHPVGDGLLLGVGQDATQEGRIRGAAVSLFDVSNPARPKQLDKVKLGKGSSDVEYDHRAFTYWGDLAVVPLQDWGDNFNGVVGITVGDQSLEIDGRVSHGDPKGEWGGWGAHIVRSLVVGDHLYTVSHAGVMQSSLDGLQTTHWTGF
jgi:uncharacterized secreted protein with C-terminal beta-propeller domain